MINQQVLSNKKKMLGFYDRWNLMKKWEFLSPTFCTWNDQSLSDNTSVIEMINQHVLLNFKKVDFVVVGIWWKIENCYHLDFVLETINCRINQEFLNIKKLLILCGRWNLIQNWEFILPDFCTWNDQSLSDNNFVLEMINHQMITILYLKWSISKCLYFVVVGIW